MVKEQKQMSHRSDPTSPFFSRAYGGFTKHQEEFFRCLLGNPHGKTILDPMAGQAFALSALATDGASVWVGDIDPAPLLLAFLRDPAIMSRAPDYNEWFRSVITTVARRRRPRRKAAKFCDGWVSPEIGRDLSDLAELLGLGMFSNPFNPKSDFWTADDDRLRFAAAITVLAARDLACFRATDNLTWLKPGGLSRHSRAIEPLRGALRSWMSYAAAAKVAGNGRVLSRLMDVAKGDVSDSPKASWIITSPPYANRLDYSRLWGPELNILGTMCRSSPDKIKAAQIGSTVVEGTSASEKDTGLLPSQVQEVLNEIRHDHSEYSEIYYYPFFRNYANSIHAALVHMSRRLRPGGKLIVFVRDTVRKDVLFPTGDLVRQVLRSPECGLDERNVEKRVIRSHIGFLRKASTRGVYGLAQQEWWIVFEKPARGGVNGRAP